MTEAILKLLKPPVAMPVDPKERDSMASDISVLLYTKHIEALGMVQNGQWNEADPLVSSNAAMQAQIDFAHDYLDYRLGQAPYGSNVPPTNHDLADRIQALIRYSNSPERAANLIKGAIECVDRAIERLWC